MAFRLKTLLKWILRICAWWNMSRIAAWLLAQQIEPVPGMQRSGNSRYCILILNLNKPGFPADVAASFSAASDIELVSWPTYTLTSFSTALLSPALSNKRYDTDDPTIAVTKLRYRNFLFRVWQHLLRYKHIDAVLAANYGYYNQREFAAALREAGTPFIALHKENVKSPGRIEYWRPIYQARGRFEGSKILVYSDTERQLQITGGVASPNDIIVTGMPRLDRAHRSRHQNKRLRNTVPRQILFFAFWKREKLTATERVSSKRTRTESNEEWGKRNWNDLCEGTYRAIVELARSRPDIRVVMKTKPQSVRVEQIIQMLGDTVPTLPENFIIVKGGDPIELIAESDAVIGFNSTALLEALACGKPIIVPDFAEAKDPAMTNLIIDLGAAVNKAGSPAEIETLAHRFLDAPNTSYHLTQTAADTLRHWVGNDDGAASQRVLEAVRTEIERAELARASSPSSRSRRLDCMPAARLMD